MEDPLRAKLELLASMASETSGASFHLGPRSDGSWMCNFYNIRTKFENQDIDVVLDSAIQWLKIKRTESTKYTIKK